MDLNTFIGYPLEIIAWLSQKKSDVKFIVKLYKPKRSLNQNNFYWEIVGLIAQALEKPNIVVHNQLLRRCEIYELIDNTPYLVLLPDTDSAEEQTFYNEELHVIPVRGDSGKYINRQGRFRWYKVLKGSRKMNTAEMTRLIDIALDDLKSMEIMLPQEEAFMKALDEHERMKNVPR